MGSVGIVVLVVGVGVVYLNFVEDFVVEEIGIFVGVVAADTVTMVAVVIL